jgi:hypothetical protein
LPEPVAALAAIATTAVAASAVNFLIDGAERDNERVVLVSPAGRQHARRHGDDRRRPGAGSSTRLARRDLVEQPVKRTGEHVVAGRRAQRSQVIAHARKSRFRTLML